MTPPTLSQRPPLAPDLRKLIVAEVVTPAIPELLGRVGFKAVSPKTNNTSCSLFWSVP